MTTDHVSHAQRRNQMIPAPLGITARYRNKTTRPDGSVHEYITNVRVIAFDDEGEPLVLSKKRLVAASTYGGFIDLDDNGSENPLVSIIPAPGWRAEYAHPDTDAKESNPLFGWGLRANGDIEPLDVDDEGSIESARSIGNFCRLYRTDADPQPA